MSSSTLTSDKVGNKGIQEAKKGVILLRKMFNLNVFWIRKYFGEKRKQKYFIGTFSNNIGGRQEGNFVTKNVQMKYFWL